MEKPKADNLDSFFSLIGSEKKKKIEEKKELIGEISLETMFQDMAVETARVKKELFEKEKTSIESATIAGDIMELLKNIIQVESKQVFTHQGVSPHIWVEELAITGDK